MGFGALGLAEITVLHPLCSYPTPEQASFQPSHTQSKLPTGWGNIGRRQRS